MLGFGASGKDLAAKWEIKYLGPETLDGVKTEKLEMVAKDPAVRKNIRKVTIWVDPENGVSLKQLFDQGRNHLPCKRVLQHQDQSAAAGRRVYFQDRHATPPTSATEPGTPSLEQFYRVRGGGLSTPKSASLQANHPSAPTLQAPRRPAQTAWGSTPACSASRGLRRSATGRCAARR